MHVLEALARGLSNVPQAREAAVCGWIIESRLTCFCMTVIDEQDQPTRSDFYDQRARRAALMTGASYVQSVRRLREVLHLGLREAVEVLDNAEWNLHEALRRAPLPDADEHDFAPSEEDVTYFCKVCEGSFTVLPDTKILAEDTNPQAPHYTLQRGDGTVHVVLYPGHWVGLTFERAATAAKLRTALDLWGSRPNQITLPLGALLNCLTQVTHV